MLQKNCNIVTNITSARFDKQACTCTGDGDIWDLNLGSRKKSHVPVLFLVTNCDFVILKCDGSTQIVMFE